MKTIEHTFTQKGFTFTQIVRRGDFAVFHRTKGGRQENYETVVIRRHNGYTIAGAEIPPAEMYPSDETWGTLGFTFSGIGAEERARAKMDELEAASLSKSACPPAA